MVVVKGGVRRCEEEERGEKEGPGGEGGGRLI